MKGATTRKMLGLTIILVVFLSLAPIFTFEAAASLPSARIMPLGDSITTGYPGPVFDGYRKDLYSNLIDSGFSVNFVGSQKNGTGMDNDNEGHGGWTADAIRDKVDDWLESTPADVVLLHIGTNDIAGGQASAGIVAEVEGILDNIDDWELDNGESVTVILARIILRSDNSGWNQTTIQYNDDLEDMALERIANGDQIILVDMASALTYPADLVDGIHPTPIGYGKMADVWYNALVEVLGYSLTVNYVGNGVVTADPDQAVYAYETEVGLTAVAADGWTFSGWSGDLVGSVNPESIIMDDNKTVTATFTRIQYKLTITANLGTTTPSVGEHLYDSGSVVTIEAYPPTAGVGERYTWLGWSGIGSGSYTGTTNSATIVMNGPITQTASWAHEYKLAIATNLGSTEPSIGEHWYPAGTSVSVQASSPPEATGVKYVSLGWSRTGGVPATGSGLIATFTINAPSTIDWTWKTQYYLTVSSAYGTAGGADWYDAGSSAYATINPTSVTNYVFSQWSGDASGSSSTSNAIIMNGPKTAVADWSKQTDTPAPTPTPTQNPTPKPTSTPSPTISPTPSSDPTVSPSPSSTVGPSNSPTQAPSDGSGSNVYLYIGIFGVLSACAIIGVVVFRRIKK